MTQEALKLALDALETELSIDWTNNDEFNESAKKMYEAIAAIKEALAQEQEPVAWVCMNNKKHDIDFDQPEIDAMPVGTMLYTHPQRTWVDLTDEEIEAIWHKDLWKSKKPHHDFARAIEAKLKDKNCVG
jgi:hypothetical protein